MGRIDLKASQELAQAFVMKTNVMESLILPIGEQPQEGKIVIALAQPDGTYNYTSNASPGFWCHIDGSLGGWAEGGVYCEFPGGLTVAYGHRPDMALEAGTKAVMKPTLIYTKDGKQYKATITINMQF